MALILRKEVTRRSFLNPLKGFLEEDQTVERRFDPLTGHVAVFNPVLEDKVRLFFGEHDWSQVEELARATKEACFMCPPKVTEVTPRYPEDFIPTGRLIEGECVLFPNLFPVAVRHAVIALGREHWRRLSAFDQGLLASGLKLGLRFLRSCAEDPGLCFGSLCANYLPPAGASLVHPHFQVVANPEAWPEERALLSASWDYFLRYGRSYWKDLLEEEEKRGERFIGRKGRVAFLTSFAPRGSNEVQAVIPVSGLSEITEEDIDHLAQGLEAVLKGYEEMGYGTFNFTLFLPPLRERVSWFAPHLRIITRQNFYPAYRTDDYFLQRQLKAELILTPPERLAEILKNKFEEV